MKRVASALCLALVVAALSPLAAQQPAAQVPRRLHISPAIFAGVAAVKQQTPDRQPAAAKPRSWMSRNWKWLVPAIAGAAGVGIALAARGTSTPVTPATQTPGTG